MPTDTFFRLPEEKRTRILEGAWSEFTAVPYAEASINRIVQTSRIPRGSFYQYFEDNRQGKERTVLTLKRLGFEHFKKAVLGE